MPDLSHQVIGAVGNERRYQLPAVMLVAAGCTLVTGCNRQLLSLLFDVPLPAAETPVATEQVPARDAATPLFLPPVDTVRPAIEGTLDPDSAVALLPRDVAGNIDWMEALRSGTIKPRDFLPDSEPPLDLPNEFQFAFDFFLEGPTPQLDAFFPHSAHTEWVDCRQCHGRIFKYQDNAVTMADILQGKACGECHGKVAFPAVTGCERCHAGLPMPPGRATPDLIGTIAMQRFADPVADDPAATGAALPDVAQAEAGGDSTAARDSSAVRDSMASVEESPDSATSIVESEPPAPRATLGYLAEELPVSQFPHWVHRVRYTCKACHVKIFEPVAGANRVTMSDISSGKACGICHDGITAFAAGFNECQRCHVDPDETPEPEPGGDGVRGGAIVRSGATHGSP